MCSSYTWSIFITSYYNMVVVNCAKNSSLSGLIFHWQIDVKLDIHANNGSHQETLRNHIGTQGTLQVVSFLVFCMLGARNRQNMHPWSSNAILACLCAPCDMISVKAVPPVVGHTLSYTVSKFGVNQTDGSWDTAIFVSPSPCSCSCSNTLPICLSLPTHLLHQIHHPWPTKHQFLCHSLHTTGLPATSCESFAFSSASLKLGPEFAKSRLKKNLIIYSAS